MSEDVDLELRRRFRESFPPGPEANKVLGDLGPSLRRARRRRRSQAGVVLFAAISLSSVGVAALGGRMSGPDRNEVVVVTGPDESAVPVVDSTLVPPDQTSTDGSETSDPEQVTDSTPSQSSTLRPRSSTSSPPSSDGPSETTPGPTTSGSTPSSPTTSKPATSTPTTTPATSESISTLPTNCGSITIRAFDPSVELVEIQALPGFEVDVKSRGPENVEVAFDNESRHCEIKAEFKDGALTTDIRDE